MIKNTQSDIWLVSDTHFNHKNLLNFKDKQDNLVRPGFSSVEEMNEVMIENWNVLVKPNDTIIHCGDVCFGEPWEYHKILKRLNGKKILIVGNHDKHIKYLIPFFEQVLVSLKINDYFSEKVLLTHYPINEFSLPNMLNIHGHIHEKIIENERYKNICVEHTNYSPIHIDSLIS